MTYSEFLLFASLHNETQRSGSIERSKIVILTQFLRNNIIRNSILRTRLGSIIKTFLRKWTYMPQVYFYRRVFPERTELLRK